MELPPVLAEEVLASLGDAVVEAGLDGVVRGWHGGAAALFGIDAADAVGRPMGDFLAEAPVRDLEELTALDAAGRSGALLPVDAALIGWPRYDLSPGALRALRQGQPVPIGADGDRQPGTVRIYADGLGFLGLGEIEAAGRLVPRRLISADAYPPNPA